MTQPATLPISIPNLPSNTSRSIEDMTTNIATPRRQPHYAVFRNYSDESEDDIGWFRSLVGIYGSKTYALLKLMSLCDSRVGVYVKDVLDALAREFSPMGVCPYAFEPGDVHDFSDGQTRFGYQFRRNSHFYSFWIQEVVIDREGSESRVQVGKADCERRGLGAEV